ncbi:MAG: hypothetical protein FD149_438 [Rhodospirillaceae bacterium]|nr:MAG: hypothetical protein FD149_438 [Rhodospirillaceae bacterium]
MIVLKSIKDTSTPLENERRGVEAMKRVLTTHADEPQAMFRPELGWISFLWGNERWGIQHVIIQRIKKDRMTEATAEVFVLSLPQVIACGRLHPSHITKRGEIGRNITAYKKTVGLSVRNGGSTPQVLILTAHEDARFKPKDTTFIKKQGTKKRNR